jgi:two-component system response regulator
MLKAAQNPAMPKARENARPILVVEDDCHDLVFALRELQRLKPCHPVDSVATVDELVDYMNGSGDYMGLERRNPPAVIVLDMHLRHADVLEAPSWLRSKLKYRKIPIIAISSPEQTEILEKAVDLGAVSWLAKPFTGSDFQQLVDDLALGVEFARETA